MVPSTGYLKYFKLIPYDEGFVLEFPPRKTPETFGPFKEQHKVFQTLKSSTKWGEILDVGTVGALNEQDLCRKYRKYHSGAGSDHGKRAWK